MKKVIFGTALASMALLSACSSDNELANVETTANNAIGFHVVGNKAETRANIINSTEDLKKTDFNVYAYINNADGGDGAPFMGGNDTAHDHNGININHKGSDWAYTNPADLRYWPTTALNFYAEVQLVLVCSHGCFLIAKRKLNTIASMSIKVLTILI